MSVIIHNDCKKSVSIYNDQIKPVIIYDNQQFSQPFHKQTSFFCKILVFLKKSESNFFLGSPKPLLGSTNIVLG